MTQITVRREVIEGTEGLKLEQTISGWFGVALPIPPKGAIKSPSPTGSCDQANAAQTDDSTVLLLAEQLKRNHKWIVSALARVSADVLDAWSRTGMTSRNMRRVGLNLFAERKNELRKLEIVELLRSESHVRGEERHKWRLTPLGLSTLKDLKATTAMRSEGES